MAVTTDKPAPYTSPSTVVGLIERYRNRGLPTPIDKEVLARASVAGGLISRTMQALETLDLIDDSGMPTQTFEALRLAPEAEFKKRLEEWLKGAYAEVFTFVDPSKDDEVRIRDAFRSYQPVGQQSRMVALFQGLCAAAGLMSERPESAPRPAARARTVSSAPSAPVQAISPRARTIARRIVHERLGKGAPPPNPAVPPPLAGLLIKLPAEGDTWTSAERAKFIAAFTAMLDFCFPVEEADTKTGTAA